MAFGNPALQGVYQSQFARLGQAVNPSGEPSSFFGASRDGSGNAGWAVQLLVVMLGLGLAGFARGGTTTRTRRSGAPGVVARLPSARPATTDAYGLETGEQDELAA